MHAAFRSKKKPDWLVRNQENIVGVNVYMCTVVSMPWSYDSIIIILIIIIIEMLFVLAIILLKIIAHLALNNNHSLE